MQTTNANPDHAEHAYSTFTILRKIPKLKLLWQNLKKAEFCLKRLKKRPLESYCPILSENESFLLKNVVKLKSEQSIS
jgi:hypothetical protein